ncbi:putative acetoacetate decarboxylase, protein NEOXANTHIN-DEFICIENT 1 [Helianthus annuus]|nr:putative acetoacetate decarboxylase, protein NEOXANTHIN-DEFICIENT 1 [Helianthus annuus]
MDIEENKCSSRYGKPPWIFKGSALYQFHLVKADIARAIIPKEFRLVEAFGYTLGGFFLADYSESPFGPFDELVVIAGIVWNPPTSHAWAARVYVNSEEACKHGRKEFGLPSRVATLSKGIKAISRGPKRKANAFLATSDVGIDSNINIRVADINGRVSTSLYDITLASPVLKTNPLKWMSMGPEIKMSLPSFSGHTEHKPQLLKYSCQIECRVKPTLPARVLGELDRKHTSESQNVELDEYSDKGELSRSVMLSKPILAFEFNCLKMEVEPPVVVSKGSHRPLY